MFLLLAFVVSLAALLYHWYRLATYWSSRGIPQVPGSFVLGNARDLWRKQRPRLFVYRDWADKYGKTYGVREGNDLMLVSSDINVVQEVFFKQFDNFYGRKLGVLQNNPDTHPRVNLFDSRGARWKRLRATASPSFSITSLKKIRPVVEDSVDNMVKILEAKYANGQTFNIHQFYMEYTMDTISRLVMGQKESRYFQNPRVEIASNFFLRDFDIPLIYINMVLPFLRPLSLKALDMFTLELSKPFHKLLHGVQTTVESRIEKRKALKSGEMPVVEDFIDLFLGSTEEHDNSEKDDFKLNETHVSKTLTPTEVLAQALVFLLAGFDTTANALGFTSWMLSRHPEVMQRCQEEVDAVCLEESISYENLNELSYLEATCKETLRFFPIGGFANSRLCMHETEVCGVKIEKGVYVQVDTMHLHFDKAIWGQDADEFLPERWLDPERKVPQTAYIPFGAGPRICVGMRLALMEEKMALAKVLRKFDILRAPGVETLDIQGSLTLTPMGVPVRIQKRA